MKVPRWVGRLRQNWAPIVLTLAVLLAVGAGTTALERAQPEFDDIPIEVGRSASVNGFLVGVDRVRVTRELTLDGPGSDDTATTENLIVVLDVRAELPAPSETRNMNNVQLVTARGVRFNPGYDSMGVRTDLGYRTSGSIWFEIPEADLAGARVTFVEREILISYRKRVVVDLGIDPATADRLRADAAPLTVLDEEVVGL